ncbi:AAA family ATPase [Anaerolentibacter hominis]|uniref:AAA family ATPase n=1 Tax=Anaerolentibacter hominis TaxID=3079009 RepID=UPI0031B89C32
MKNLILINGTMGVGKSTVGRELLKLLPGCVYLDGDWCWNMNPFVVNEETKKMVIGNIQFLLNRFLQCSVYQNVVFCWVMDEARIIREVLAGLSGDDYRLSCFTLVCSEQKLKERLERDVKENLRAPDVIERSLARLCRYDRMNTVKIDVGQMSGREAAEEIKIRIERQMSESE